MEAVELEHSCSGSDDDWEGVDEEVSLSMQTLCLFCPEVFNSAELMFEHCRAQHSFDMVDYSYRMGLNCINYIKFINYIRSQKPSSTEIKEFSLKTCPWLGDENMKPYDDTDPLLQFDIEDFIQEKIAERKDIDDNITIPHSKFQEICQKLAEKEMKLENARDTITRMKIWELFDKFADYFRFISNNWRYRSGFSYYFLKFMNWHTSYKIKQEIQYIIEHELEHAQTILLCNNQQCSTVNNRSSKEDNKSSANDEDNYYFSTYDHFAIHHEMLQDKIRTKAYQDAILNNPEVFKNKRVLDVGCGTSILSMFAAKAGAAHVLGVDKSDVIFQAMDIVRENGYEDVIELFKGRVEDMPMDQEKMDVIVSEWMGYFLLFEGMLDSVIYARDKFLRPGGHIFPNRCTLSILAVCDTDKYKEFVHFWDDVYGFKMTVMKKDVIKEANVETIKPETVCCPPVVVKELDLNVCQISDTEFTSSFDLVMSRDCEVTALVGFFDAYFDHELAQKVLLSTSPNCKPTHWKQTMFLLQHPVKVTTGEVIKCQITCRKNRRDPRSLIVKLNFGQYQNQYHLS